MWEDGEYNWNKIELRKIGSFRDEVKKWIASCNWNGQRPSREADI
jgi:hypothetical protein